MHSTFAIAHGLAAVIGGAPDAFCGMRHDPCRPGEVLYTFSWIRGGSFGRAEVVKPDDSSSAAAPMSAWVLPLVDIRKVDCDFNVTNPGRIPNDYTVKLKVEVHWDDRSVVLDAIPSMNSYARPGLEKLIELVLASMRDRSL
ncbi:hypothetical protein [Mycobacterium riyadhense]|uniref:hypothetical protein n=1 Tax=Mycobacterium riyadhense TaxID=486698 RepID=UPI00195659B7|nr:hypothetical protein [Mycobacterium riyadhense]